MANGLGFIFQQTLPTSDFSYEGFTKRNVYAISILRIPSLAQRQVRITLQAGTDRTWGIAQAYVGHKAASGDPYDYAAAPTQITFNGGSPTVSIALDQTVQSDWVNFSWNKTSSLIVAITTVNDSAQGGPRISALVPGVDLYYFFQGDASEIDASGYSGPFGSYVGIAAIEMDGFDDGVKVQPVFTQSFDMVMRRTRVLT